jgi:DNA-binding transcriptional MerR regulator
VRFRIDELAARAGVSVDTVRYYQTRGLLEPPQREGRVAWYSADHLERLRHVRSLQAQGFTLASIDRLLSGDVSPADSALAAALTGDSRDPEELTLAQLAERTGVSVPILQALEREGLLVPRLADDEPRYTAADAEAVRAGMTLLETGVPLGELLDLARRHDEAMSAVAEHAVDLFVRFVRDPVRGTAADEQEAAARLLAAFDDMLPAATTLVAHHFRRAVLAAAQARAEAELRD